MDQSEINAIRALLECGTRRWPQRVHSIQALSADDARAFVAIATVTGNEQALSCCKLV